MLSQNRRETIRHEMLHLIGDVYGLRTVGGAKALQTLFLEASVVLDLKEGQIAFTHKDLSVARLNHIAAFGALTPAVVDDAIAFQSALRTKDVSPLYQSESVSDADRHAYDQTPIDFNDVISAGLVARKYMELFGTGFTQFANNLDKANHFHDTFNLPALVKLNRVREAIRHLPLMREKVLEEMYRRVS